VVARADTLLGETTMTHLHYINGQLDAADRYQAYLERCQEARLAERRERTRKKLRGQAFDSYIDPDEEEREDPGQDPASQDQEKNPEGDSDPGGGFGNHYA
jgi:hypothetical protein